MSDIIRKFGWIPDVPDARDIYYSAPRDISIMPAINMQEYCPPVWDQGTLGSCTANAILAAHQFEQIKLFSISESVMLSRLFLYYNEREMEGSVSIDRGAQIRSGMKSLVSQGACPELEWPYNITAFTTKPSPQCYESALKYKIVQYQRVGQSLAELQSCLMSRPFVCGIAIYDSFKSDQVARTGIVPMPNLFRERMLGGHAIMCVGYDNGTGRFRMRNSWGTEWGQNGYFEIPYEYLTNRNLSADFWTIQMVEK